jgi:hypothetical protein
MEAEDHRLPTVATKPDRDGRATKIRVAGTFRFMKRTNSPLTWAARPEKLLRGWPRFLRDKEAFGRLTMVTPADHLAAVVFQMLS